MGAHQVLAMPLLKCNKVIYIKKTLLMLPVSVCILFKFRLFALRKVSIILMNYTCEAFYKAPGDDVILAQNGHWLTGV